MRADDELTAAVPGGYLSPTVDTTDELIRETIRGEIPAWRSLQLRLAPHIVAIARSHSSMRSKGLAGLRDDIAEVATLTFERLARDNFENLRSFQGRQEPPAECAPEARGHTFESWLYGAVDFSVRQHVRARFGRPPKPGTSSGVWQPSKRDLNTDAERLDWDDDAFPLYAEDVASKLAAAEIFSHVEAKFTAREVRALRLYYLDDEGFDVIARALKLPNEKAAESMIRKLNARLRYHFMQSSASRKASAG
jgi:hypothetical protein